MPNLQSYDPTEFFPALPAGTHRMTENLALAMFEAADGTADGRALTVNLAKRVFAFGEAWRGPVPRYPAAVLILLHLSGVADPTPLPLLLSRSADGSDQLIFGIRSDACP